jgi:hypothetical protein
VPIRVPDGRNGGLHGVSSVPQLKKVWTPGETRDLSRKMLALATGLALGIVYGLPPR